MKKIKFVIASIFLINFIIAIPAFTAEVKQTLPSSATPVKAAPVVAPAQIKQPATPPAASVTPNATQKQIQQPPIPPAGNVAPAAPTQIQQPQPLAPPSVDTYSYNPSGKPDPFQPIAEIVKAQKDIEAQKNVGEKKQDAKKRSDPTSMFPLQRAATETYRVVGIAGDKDHRVAVVEDAAKKFYPLSVGTHIGLYNGKVIEIMADRVIVEEYETKKAKRVILKLRIN
jgi:Tfp pilus assembly protein PilP